VGDVVVLEHQARVDGRDRGLDEGAHGRVVLGAIDDVEQIDRRVLDPNRGLAAVVFLDDDGRHRL
jgi:hypothetical protein